MMQIDMGPLLGRAWWEVPLPACPDCGGDLVWYEAGYVPGTRKCMGKPTNLFPEITSILDARLPQPPYHELAPDREGKIARLLTEYRNVCSDKKVYEIDEALLALLLPYTRKSYDPRGGCGGLYTVYVEDGHAILKRAVFID